MKIPLFRSLRFKLIIASVIVEVVMLTILVTNSLRTMEEKLLALADVRQEEVRHLLNTALAPPLVQRDYATLQEIMDKSRREEGIVYLMLFDEMDKPIVASGWKLAEPLPPTDVSSLATLAEEVHRFDGVIPITFAGIAYGKLHYGVSTDYLYHAREKLLRESIFIAGAEVLLSVLILTALGVWLTRHLGQLIRFSHAVERGDYSVRVPVRSQDEIGQLSLTFNNMVQSIYRQVEELRTNEAKFHAIADYTYDWEAWHGPGQELIWLNPSVERMTGYTVEECEAMEDFPFPLIHRDDVANARRDYTFNRRGSTGIARFRVVRKDQSVFWAETVWQPIYADSGSYLGIRSSIRDVSDQTRAEQGLQEKIAELHVSEEKQRQLLQLSQQEQARMLALLGAMKLGILFETSDQKVAYYNPALRQIWLIESQIELAGMHTTQVLDYSHNVLSHPGNAKEDILVACSADNFSDPVEIELADGRVVTQLCYPVRDSDEHLIGRLWIYEDVTRERQTAEQLVYLAERDPLTGLYNRRRFEDELARALASASRRNSSGALLFFDLDEFKYINDTFGHRAGDAMLIRVGHEVSTLIRNSEFLSRLGGDEFAILVPDGTQKEAEALAERITRAIYHIPFRFEGRNLRLTTSVGIALYPFHATAQDELIAHADAAMYQAKEAGKNIWRLYRPELDTSHQMLDRMSWVNRIAHALEKNLLSLHFQGIYHVHDGSLAHVEVLVRMLDEDRHNEPIMPGRFIPFAEKSGQILHIDRWVIRKGLERIATDPEFPPVPISVNISGRSFDDPSLPQYISEQLAEFGISPERLLVELTETSAISDLHDAQRFIESLQKTGCRVCLDDFGAGFSSFTYLKHLKADVLKIDGQFIRDLPVDSENQVFVRAIVNVAQGLKKHTIAEFVENQRTLNMLSGFGVTMVQGYHLHRPGPTPPPLKIVALSTAGVANEKK